MANPLKSFWPIYFGTSELCCYCLQSVFLQGMLFGGQERYSCPIPLVKKLVLHKCKQWLFNPGKCSTSTRQQLTTWISCMFSSGNLHTNVGELWFKTFWQRVIIKSKWSNVLRSDHCACLSEFLFQISVAFLKWEDLFILKERWGRGNRDHEILHFSAW